MRSFNKECLIISVLIGVLMPFVIPSAFSGEGMGRYAYGLPFNFVTIYQREPTSMWFSSNFFTGNAGVSVDPLRFVLNVFSYFLLIKAAVYMFTKDKA